MTSDDQINPWECVTYFFITCLLVFTFFYFQDKLILISSFFHNHPKKQSTKSCQCLDSPIGQRSPVVIPRAVRLAARCGPRRGGGRAAAGHRCLGPLDRPVGRRDRERRRPHAGPGCSVYRGCVWLLLRPKPASRTPSSSRLQSSKSSPPTHAGSCSSLGESDGSYPWV